MQSSHCEEYERATPLPQELFSISLTFPPWFLLFTFLHGKYAEYLPWSMGESQVFIFLSFFSFVSFSQA